jgi:hypothetical protein
VAWKSWNADTRGLFHRESEQLNPERWSEMSTSDKNYARFVFDVGFVNQRVPSPARMEGRNAFFNEMDIDPAEFDWTAWRIYMGYSDDSD